MMLSFGMFPFEIGTAPFQELARSRSWRYGRTARFGVREASQFLGPGDDQVTLSGAIIPGLAGAFWSIEKLAQIAEEGLAWPLVSGTGSVLGHFVIDQLDHKESTFLVDGLARKGDFTLTLHRVADDARQEGSTGALSAFNPLAAAGGVAAPIANVSPDRLRQAASSSGLSLSSLSDLVGLPQATIDGLVSGAMPTLPSADLELVAQALGVPSDWLAGAELVSGAI